MNKYKPLIRFFSTAAALYVLWYFMYDLWLHPLGVLDTIVVDNTLLISKAILNILGVPAIINNRALAFGDGGGLWIGDPCNGISLFALYTGFILSYPGPFKAKLVFIPAGILIIHLMNCLRVVGLALIQIHASQSLEFNHTYTFTFVVYASIFLLWMLWVNRFGKRRDRKSNE